MKQFVQILSIVCFLGASSTVIAQRPERPEKPVKTISGKIIDNGNDSPIPYASVLVKSVATDNMLTGTTTNDEGFFKVNTDSSEVYIEISFIGYKATTFKDLEWNNNSVDLGIVKLSEDSETLDEFQVTGEKSTMEFKLDKRVFNVGKDISSSGAGALDVLNNVPSVGVDIEGNVSLRGNSGVQILIDGKPSVLSDDPANALGSITADMIEKVEVITNPSAKYDAEGTSGIINIILKKEEKKGVNGSVSINTGYPHNHSIGASLNVRTTKFNFFTQLGGGYRSLPRFNESINENKVDETIIESEGIAYRNEYFFNITLGADYYINELNTLTLSGNFAYEVESQPSETEFKLFDGNDLMTSNYKRIETTSAKNPKWQYDLQYQKTFKNNKEHVLQFATLGRFFGKDQESEFTNEVYSGSNMLNDQRTETEFYQSNYTFKLDYVNPITKSITLETGAMYDINDVGNDFGVFDQSGDLWLVDSSLTNNFEYNQKVLGLYVTGSYEGKKWGIKLGLRVENTDLKTVLTNTNEQNNQNYTNFFPTVHTSYKFNKNISMQAGYSRRVFRPRLWDLNPFFNIQNTYNIRTGNPNLMPEFADSYELTSIFVYDKVSLNASVYYLYTTDVTERISYFVDNVNITTPENIGIRHKIGFEFNGKYDPAKWVSIMGDFNYGYFQRLGEFESQDFSFNGDQYSARLMTKFKIPAGIDLELTGNYNSKVKTVQGETSGFASADFGIRKKLWKGKGVINFSIRDIFASRIRENVIDQPTYSLYSFGKRGRFFTLGFSYSFGKGEAMSYSGGGRKR